MTLGDFYCHLALTVSCHKRSLGRKDIQDAPELCLSPLSPISVYPCESFLRRKGKGRRDTVPPGPKAVCQWPQEGDRSRHRALPAQSCPSWFPVPQTSREGLITGCWTLSVTLRLWRVVLLSTLPRTGHSGKCKELGVTRLLAVLKTSYRGICAIATL